MIDLFRITGGKFPLQTIMPWHNADINNIKSKNILFLSQIIASGKFLLNFYDIQLKIFCLTRINSVTPRWFKLLKRSF